MTDRPIIFSAPMVRAWLEGRKMMTRRLAWQAPQVAIQVDDGSIEPIKVPSIWQRVNTGDRLWVREGLRRVDESWRYAADDKPVTLLCVDPRVSAMVAWAHHQQRDNVTAIHMPRWASRLTISVTATRLEPLHAITEADAIAEGVELETANPPFYYVPGIYPHSITAVGVEEPGASAVRSFAKLWDHLHGVGAWNRNPDVVVLTGNARQTNIDWPPSGEAA